MTPQSQVEAALCQAPYLHEEDVAQARAGLEPEDAYSRLAELFGALADTTRAKIVHALVRQELCSCDLAAVVGMSASATSQHLRVLRNLRLVKFRRAGKLVYYSLVDAHVAFLVQVGFTHLGHHDPLQREQGAPVAVATEAP